MKQVTNRAFALCRKKIDTRYQHPHDVALAIYLWLISEFDDERTEYLARQIQLTENLFWADQLASKMLYGLASKLTSNSHNDISDMAIHTSPQYIKPARLSSSRDSSQFELKNEIKKAEPGSISNPSTFDSVQHGLKNYA